MFLSFIAMPPLPSHLHRSKPPRRNRRSGGQIGSRCIPRPPCKLVHPNRKNCVVDTSSGNDRGPEMHGGPPNESPLLIWAAWASRFLISQSLFPLLLKVTFIGVYNTAGQIRFLCIHSNYGNPYGCNPACPRRIDVERNERRPCVAAANTNRQRALALAIASPLFMSGGSSGNVIANPPVRSPPDT